MNIGAAAQASGVSAKMIRYAESTGLIPEAQRTKAGYRLYTDRCANTSRFIHRTRKLAFSIERMRLLVGLWQDCHPSREVKAIALNHVAELDRRIAGLGVMRNALQVLADARRGDHRPECPIRHELEGAPALGAEKAA